MSGLFFATALRNLLRHKLQSLTNIASLAIGLTVFGFTFLYVKQELSYDRAWPDAERIHRLVVEQRGIPGMRDGVFNSVNARAHPAILNYFAPQIDKLTRLHSLPVRFKEATSTARSNLYFVDPEFADIFQLDVVAGDLRRALSGPGFIALEESYARTPGANLVPGDRGVIQSITEVELEYEVAAIFRLPPDISPSLKFEQLTLMHEYSLPLFSGDQRQVPSWESGAQIWLTLAPEVEIDTFNEMQAAFIDVAVTTFDQTLGSERNISDHLFYRWQPVTEIHFNPVGFEARASSAGDITRVITFAVVGLLVLLVGCSNSVSLSLANAIERRRDSGVRKTVGALPSDILWQHLGESILLALIALVPAIALLELLLPAFKTLLPFATQIDFGWNEYVLLALITAVVGLSNGIYPALVLSGVRPQAVLKSGPVSHLKGGLSLRSWLVGAQFCFASLLLIGTAALYLQLAVTRSQPLGFTSENLVALQLSNEQERMNGATLRVELEKIPGVVRVVSVGNFTNENQSANSNTWTFVRETNDDEEVKAQMSAINSGFAEIMGIPVLAGRIPEPLPRVRNQPEQNETPDQSLAQPIAVNRTTILALGFANPEEAAEQIVFMRFTSGQDGQTFHGPMRIVGVLEDSSYASLRRIPGPEIYSPMSPDSGHVLLLKYEEVIEASLQERIQQTAQAVNGQPLQYLRFVEPHIQAAFIQEQNESRLLLICGGLAIFLACIGLYGLAAFAIERRIKEVGIRKVLGASVLNIVGLYLWRFSRPVLLANLLAWPFAIYFVLRWIERFPYQLEKAWLLPLCLGTALVVLMISVLTVSVITVRAAAAKPVQSLRYE